MNLKETGNFIAERRKAKKLTQLKLADLLNVSEKTISKWECGNGFPDSSLMLPLCSALEINANELLSGKILSDVEYKAQAEQNLVELKTEQQRNAKFLLTIEFTMGYIVVFLCLSLILIGGMANISKWLGVTMIALGFATMLVSCLFLIRIEQRAGYYECQHCKHRYVPKYISVLWAMHFGTTRYMKCPNCNKISWQKKVAKND